jgi:competence protein ComEC
MPTFPRELPLFKISIAIALGIYIQDLLKVDAYISLFGLTLTSVWFISLHQKKILGVSHVLRSGLIYVSFFFLGAGLYVIQEKATLNDRIEKLKYEKIEVLAQCTSIPSHNQMTQFEARITHIETRQNSFESIRSITVLIHVKDSMFQIRNGDEIRVKGIFKNTSKSQSPMSFDYSRYLKFRKISYQSYVNPQDITILNENLEPWYSRTRGWAINKFERNLSPTNAAIASALVLGHRGLINEDMYKAFAQTGSMHVLAVSGLHVGILSTLLGIVLSLLRSNSLSARCIKILILVLGIWSFALITGGSPSVIRASIMFSILEIGKIWKGHYSIYNSIGAAALILLCIDPFMLFHVGFQLSFSAILSIVMFCPKITRLLAFKNLVLNFLWRLLCVAVSVQILTLPISLYYFHQFPVYFMVTGISAVLLAIAILSSGLVLLFFSMFFSMGSLWTLYDFLVSLLSMSTYFIHSLPYGLIPNVAFDQISVLLSFLAIGIFNFYVFHNEKQAAILGLVVFLVMIGYKEMQHYNESKRSEIVFYDTRKPLVDIIVAGRTYCYAHPDLSDKNISFATRNFRIFKRANDVIMIKTLDELQSFYKANESILGEVEIFDVSGVFQITDLKGTKITEL